MNESMKYLENIAKGKIKPKKSPYIKKLEPELKKIGKKVGKYLKELEKEESKQ